LKAFGRDVLEEPPHKLFSTDPAMVLDAVAVAVTEGHSRSSERRRERGGKPAV
jgi:hypothetical protein